MKKFLNTLWQFTRGKEDKDNFIQKALKVCKVFNTFTANYELSRSPRFLYFCQLRVNSYFRDPLFLPTTSYLVVTKFIIFANYEITRTTIIFNFSFIYSKMNGFYYFCWKTKNTKNPYPGFSNIFVFHVSSSNVLHYTSTVRICWK